MSDTTLQESIITTNNLDYGLNKIHQNFGHGLMVIYGYALLQRETCVVKIFSTHIGMTNFVMIIISKKVVFKNDCVYRNACLKCTAMHRFVLWNAFCNQRKNKKQKQNKDMNVQSLNKSLVKLRSSVHIHNYGQLAPFRQYKGPPSRIHGQE